MPAKILDGRKLAEKIKDEVKKAASQKAVTLAVVIATDDESAHYYARHIKKAGEAANVKVNIVDLQSAATQDELVKELKHLANDSKTHGIILQTPLPAHVNVDDLRALIPPHKDVDGANPISAGRLFSGLKAFSPSTVAAVLHIIKAYKVELSGQHVVVIGRSLVVGKPLSFLLLDQNATVTICHSKTKNLPSITKQADILIVAVGQPNMVDGSYIKGGAIVVDVGTNVTGDGKLVGDVDLEKIKNVASAYTPVPGGVGPVTTAILLAQTVQATTLNSL